MSQAMSKFLELCIPTVVKNTEALTKKDIGQDYMLHISPDKHSKPFIPWIGRRQGKTEDRTVPRITVSTCLLGCYIGYAAAIHDVIESDPKEWKQGYYIYAFDYDECLKPNNSLVYDARRSNEHWLVSYSKETLNYKPRLVGKCFISEVVTRSISGKKNQIDIQLYIQVNEPMDFALDVPLTKGYWIVEGPGDVNLLSFDKAKAFSVREISKEEFDRAKEQSASLLGMDFKIDSPLQAW